MRTKLTILTVYARGRNWSALVHAPVNQEGRPQLSLEQCLDAIERANNIEFPTGTLMCIGGA